MLQEEQASSLAVPNTHLKLPLRLNQRNYFARKYPSMERFKAIWSLALQVQVVSSQVIWLRHSEIAFLADLDCLGGLVIEYESLLDWHITHTAQFRVVLDQAPGRLWRVFIQ